MQPLHRFSDKVKEERDASIVKMRDAGYKYGPIGRSHRVSEASARRIYKERKRR